MAHSGCEHSQARSPEGLGNPEALAFTATNVRSEAPGTLQDPVGQRLREGGDEKGALIVGQVGRLFEVFDHPEEVGGLDREGGKVLQIVERGQIGPSAGEIGEFNDLVLCWRKIRLHDSAEVRVDQTGNGNPALPGDADRHQERLGESRGSVVHRSIGYLHAEQPGREGLVLVNGLEGPLTHLGLIGGVRGDELGAAEEIGDHLRDVVLITPGTHVDLVLRGRGHIARKTFHEAAQVPLAQGSRKVHVSGSAAVRGDCGKEIIEALCSDHPEHGGNLFVRVRQISHGFSPFKRLRYATWFMRPLSSAGSLGLISMIQPDS
ncbi:MAG: hypothetical protein H6R37_1101 [Deltaproteobacteria bacterium]|nr:hypothetical protein [Deltaproteobacteria bacterium]